MITINLDSIYMLVIIGAIAAILLSVLIYIFIEFVKGIKHEKHINIVMEVLEIKKELIDKPEIYNEAKADVKKHFKK